MSSLEIKIKWRVVFLAGEGGVRQNPQDPNCDPCAKVWYYTGFVTLINSFKETSYIHIIPAFTWHIPLHGHYSRCMSVLRLFFRVLFSGSTKMIISIGSSILGFTNVWPSHLCQVTLLYLSVAFPSWRHWRDLTKRWRKFQKPFVLLTLLNVMKEQHATWVLIDFWSYNNLFLP